MYLTIQIRFTIQWIGIYYATKVLLLIDKKINNIN